MSKLIDVSKKIQGKSIEKASDELIEQRLKICKACTMDDSGKPTIIGITGQCKDCWCIVADKVTYKDESCKSREKW